MFEPLEGDPPTVRLITLCGIRALLDTLLMI